MRGRFDTLSKLAARGVRFAWWLKGGRTVRVFDQAVRFSARTAFPIRPMLRLPASGAASSIVRYTDFVQLHSIFRWLEACRDPPVVIDVGAFHGEYAVLLGSAVQRRGGTVIAVEPAPDAFQILLENVSLNGLEDTVRCERVGVWRQAGRARVEKLGPETSLHMVSSDDCEQATVPLETLERLVSKYVSPMSVSWRSTWRAPSYQFSRAFRGTRLRWARCFARCIRTRGGALATRRMTCGTS